LLFLESAQVLAADLRPLLDLGKVESLPQASLSEAIAYLEHGASVYAGQTEAESSAYTPSAIAAVAAR
jgi:hypothetical protein